MKKQEEVSEKTVPIPNDPYQSILEQTHSALFVVEPNTGRVIFFNNNAHRHLGYTREEFSKLKIFDFNPLQSDEETKKLLEAIGIKGTHIYKTKIRTKAGKMQSVQFTAKQITIDGNTFLLLEGHEIAERKLSERFKRLSTAIFDAAAEAILVTDDDQNIISVNPAFTRITGYPPEEVLGENPKILQSGKHNRAFYKAMWKAIHTTGHWQGEIWNRRKNGETYPEWLSIMAVEDDREHIIQYIGLFSDISQRKAGELRLEHQAYYDPLTNLPNRILFMERLGQAIRQARRNRSKAACLFVDLDRFKPVNDVFGHHAGDQVLKMTSERLLSCVRETDTVARSGGDEFLVVLTNIKEREEASIVAREILAKLSDPFQLKGDKTSIGASIGITIVPDDSEKESVLINNADKAMYRSKDSGRNTYYFFNRKM